MEDVSIRFQSCIGIILILIVSWFFSESKQNVLISRVLKQLTIVFIFAVLLVTIPQVKEVFFYLNKIVQHLQVATEFGTSFVFGYLGGAFYFHAFTLHVFHGCVCKRDFGLFRHFWTINAYVMHTRSATANGSH